MKAYIGIGEMPVKVKCVVDADGPVVVEVRDVVTGLNVQQYLEQDVLDRLAEDWAICENFAASEVCF